MRNGDERSAAAARSPELAVAEPNCCGVPMVHNSGTGKYECADAYFALLDDGVIRDDDPPGLTDPQEVPTAHRALYEHWLNSMRPDGFDQATQQ